MEKDIQNWLKNTLETSQFQLEYWTSRKLGDTDGWGNLLAPSFQNSNSVSGSGILLIGSDSHSKQSVALQILNLLKPEAYEGIFLDGTDLGDDGFTLAKEKIDCLLDHFYDSGMGLCIVLDNSEKYNCKRKILQFLGQKLCEYSMYRDQLTPLFLILMDENEQDIPALLRDCLKLCRLQPPSQAKRTAYLDNYAKSLRDYVSLKLFAQVTEGISYVQLQNLITLVECYVDSLDGRGLSDEELKTFLESQMPNHSSEHPIQEISKSVNKLVNQLPQLLANKSVSGVRIPPKQTDSTNDNINDTYNTGGNVTHEDIENMPPRQLAFELFGEDRVEELLQMTV